MERSRKPRGAKRDAKKNRLRKLLKARDAFAKIYGEYHGVKGIGYGVKEVKGKFTKTWAILVFVEEKLKPIRLDKLGRKPLPKRFGGFPTDIVVMSRGVPAQHGPGPNNPWRPLIGGLEIGLQSGNAILQEGTGCLVVKQGTALRLLTCSHVLLRCDPATHTLNPVPGAQITQPGAVGQVIGTVGKLDITVDAGVVNLDPNVGGTPRRILTENGPVNLDDFWIGTRNEFPPNLDVRMFGAASQGTHGQVVQFDLPDHPFECIATIGPLVKIQGVGGNFGVDGDSGGAVYTEQDGERILLAMFIGFDKDKPSIGYAVPIQAIFTRLGVRF